MEGGRGEREEEGGLNNKVHVGGEDGRRSFCFSSSSHSQRKKSSPYHIWDGQYKVPPHVHHLFEHAVQCHPHNGRKHSLK